MVKIHNACASSTILHTQKKNTKWSVISATGLVCSIQLELNDVLWARVLEDKKSGRGEICVANFKATL